MARRGSYSAGGREQRWGGTYVEALESAAAILLTKKGKKNVKGGKREVMLKRDAKMSSGFLYRM
jgi:hypothetical protein